MMMMMDIRFALDEPKKSDVITKITLKFDISTNVWMTWDDMG
jgi:hypothetical protein